MHRQTVSASAVNLMCQKRKKCTLAETQGGSLRVVLVRVCSQVILKPTPIIYLVYEKNDLFIYLIDQNVYIFDFYIPSLLSVSKVYK